MSAIIAVVCLISLIMFFKNESFDTLSMLYELSSVVSYSLMIIGVFFWRKCYIFLKVFMFLYCIRIMFDLGYLIFAMISACISLSMKVDSDREKELTGKF